MITYDIKKPETRGVYLSKMVIALCLAAFFGSQVLSAAEEPDSDKDKWLALFDQLSGRPAQYTFVNGDTEKFEAHHWIADGYVGGIEDLSTDLELPHDISMSGTGHALVGANDYKGEVSVKKKDLGYIHFDYDEFRKYYDSTGGVYKRFILLGHNELDQDLQLDIGHIRIETGLTPEEWPHLIFAYERKFKDGEKSHLTWTAVREGTVTRNIGPSWQDIDETVDTFEINVEHEVSGFELNGEQKWEFVRTKADREERSLSTTTDPADKKIRVQHQEPETDLMTTTAGVQRWFLGDRVFVGTDYRFSNLDNQEVESIFEMDEKRNPRSFGTSPKQIRNAMAQNEFNSNIWVGSLMAIPWQNLTVGTKFKAETIRRKSDSTYPSDTTDPPDGVANTTEVSNNDGRIVSWGEAFSVRFSGIPKTALYNELEFEQVRNWLSEDRTSLAGQSIANANEIFSRETITYVRRGNWTVGGRVMPCRFVDLTSQFRYRQNNNDYDDIRETDPGATTARSAFVDWNNVQTEEFNTRITFKPFRWLQPSFRYQFLDQDYFSRVESESSDVKTDMTSHIYTFDLLWQPLPELLATASVSRQTAVTQTPARFAPLASGNTPAYNAEVNTWLFSLVYTVWQDVTANASLQYSRADNFNDFSSYGLPLGADFREVSLTTSLRWPLTKTITIEPNYGFYHYQANPDAEFGNYNAHVAWLDVSISLG